MCGTWGFMIVLPVVRLILCRFFSCEIIGNLRELHLMMFAGLFWLCQWWICSLSVIHHKCQCILDKLGSENFVSVRHPLNGNSGRVSNSINRG